MDINFLASVVGLLVTLSVASERLVEIVKNVVTPLNREWSTPTKEGWRRSIIQSLAVVAGIITVSLAMPVIGPVMDGKVPEDSYWQVVIALGLLASGGSGFWNSILAYVLQVKNIKTTEAIDKKTELAAKLAVTQQ